MEIEKNDKYYNNYLTDNRDSRICRNAQMHHEKKKRDERDENNFRNGNHPRYSVLKIPILPLRYSLFSFEYSTFTAIVFVELL